MLFAEMEMDWTHIATGALGVATGIVGVVGTWLLKVYKLRNENNSKTRADALLEWKSIADERKVQIDSMGKENGLLGSKIILMTSEIATCKETVHSMRERLRYLNAAVFQMQKGCMLEKGCPLMSGIYESPPKGAIPPGTQVNPDFGQDI